jgi:hypothetical protein
MFSLPSPSNLVVSTVAFFWAGWYARRWMDEHELPRGITRSLLVLIVASLASCGAGTVVDQFTEAPQAVKSGNTSIDDTASVLQK